MLIQYSGWRAVFVVNVPICVVVAVVAMAVIPAGRRAGAVADGWWAAVLLSGGVGAVFAAASQARWWPGPLTWLIGLSGVFAIGVALLEGSGGPGGGLVVRWWRTVVVDTVGLFVAVAVFGYLLAVPMLVAGPVGLSRRGVGVCVGVGAVVAVVTALVVGRWVSPSSARWCGAAGLVGVAVGFAQLGSAHFAGVDP
ncbi:hypothetical protein, partial [Nocardia noduli]|uniref:hypothetical protein n=1 Tax=Nocardia noduli TaxID=2815722 RepID=UPI001C2448E5